MRLGMELADNQEPEALRPAGTNPWYVLATIWGEPDRGQDDALHVRNRVAWNRWLAPAFSDALKERLRQGGTDEEELEPLPPDQQEELRARARARGVELPELRGPAQPPGIDFSGCRFCRAFLPVGFVFPGGATFEKSRFESLTSFSSAHFDGASSFEGAVFAEAAAFNEVTFASEAARLFRRGRTLEDGTAVRFDRARFLKEAQFLDAAFAGMASFARARFMRGGWFGGAEFSTWASFDASFFAGSITRFAGARFRGTAHFPRAVFAGAAHFNEAEFEGPADFRSCRFDDAVLFSNGRFASSTTFAGARFAAAPDFRDRSFPHATEWRAVGWPRPPRDPDGAWHAEQRYGSLRHAMDQAGRQEHARDFLALELGCRQRCSPWAIRLAIGSYRLLSDFGRSAMRPLTAWVAALLLAFLVQGAVLAPERFRVPSSFAGEIFKLTLSSASVVGSSIFDPRRREAIETALTEGAAVDCARLAAASPAPIHCAGAELRVVIPFYLQLAELLHALFSGICLFLIVLAVRNWLRLK